MADATFAKLAPYLQDPLVLAGFALFLLFSFFRLVIAHGLIPQLSRPAGYRYLRLISTFGFVLALLVVCLGFWQKHTELSEAEQRRALALLRSELEHNKAVTAQLIKNTETLLNLTMTVASVLRSPGIPALAALFPPENLDVTNGTAAAGSLTMSDLALQRFAAGRFLDRRLELERMKQASIAIGSTIDRTLPTIGSLSDAAHTRYQFATSAWDANAAVLRKISLFPIDKIQDLNASSRRLRANYDVIVDSVGAYLNAVRAMMVSKLDRPMLQSTLAAEHLVFTLLAGYGKDLAAEAEKYDYNIKALAKI